MMRKLLLAACFASLPVWVLAQGFQTAFPSQQFPNSPAPTAPTQATGDNSTAIATDAFVANTLASPPIIGGTTQAAGHFSSLFASSLLSLSGGTIQQTRTVTASGAITLGTGDNVVFVKKNTGAATAVANISGATQNGREFVVIDAKGDAATNNITFTPASGTVNGAATLVLATNYGRMVLICDGTNWYGSRIAP